MGSRRKSQNKTAHTDIEEIEMNPDKFAQILLSCLKDKEVIKQFRDVTGFQNIQDSVNSLSRNIENLKKTIEAKDVVITALKEEVKTLNHKVDDLEQYSRRNSVRVTGIPENENEAIGKSVLEMINNRMKVEPPVQAHELDRVHRVGRLQEHKSRAVLVKFATYASRHRVYSERRRLNPKRKIDGAAWEATTDNETTEEDQPRIYLNEDLSKVRSELLFLSRKAKRGTKIMDCWSYDGRIVVKDLKGKISTVTSENELITCFYNKA